jgi:hypothetical protein
MLMTLGLYNETSTLNLARRIIPVISTVAAVNTGFLRYSRGLRFLKVIIRE